MKENIKTNDELIAKIIIMYFLILPIYNILKLQIGIKAHFIIPVFFLIIIFINRKKMNFKYFGLILLFFVIQIPYSLLGYKDYIYNWVGLMYLLFCYSLPWFVVGYSIKDSSKIVYQFKRMSIPILISNILLIVYCYVNNRSMLGNMEISYSILPFIIFSFYTFLENKSIKYLIYALITTSIVVIVGSRGTILCIGIFFILYLALNMKKHFVIIVSLIVLLILGIINYDLILERTISILNSYGIGSRTLVKLQNGEITNDTGRGRIHDVAWKYLDKAPLTGLGLGVERIYINKEINNMTKDMTSSYPHNLFIEILAQFGYVLRWFINIRISKFIYLFHGKGK